MPTAVVVASIVNTNMSEAGFRRHMVEQLRVNDRKLLDRLADADSDANVVTAVLNVDEFLAYLIQNFPNVVDAAIATTETHDAVAHDIAPLDNVAPANAAPDTAIAAQPLEVEVDTAKMSEGEFMNYMMAQLDAGKVEPMVRFTDQAWDHEEWDDEGDIGEDISHYPFFY